MVEKFPTPCMERRDAGVVVPIPMNPRGSTINRGLDVPMSPTTNTGVEVDCSSTENVPHGEVVPIPTLPMLVVEVSMVRRGTAVVEVAMLHALYTLLGMVEVEDEA